MLLFDVTREFDALIKDKLGDQKEKYDFIKNHEKKITFLNNVCEQIQIYEQRFGNRITKDGRDKIIEMGVTLFITRAFDHHAYHSQSEMKRIQAQKEARDTEEIQSVLKEVD